MCDVNQNPAAEELLHAMLPVAVVQNSLDDLADERSLAFVELGEICNEFRFRMEALCIQGTNQLSFHESELPWNRLERTLRSLYAEDDDRETCTRFVERTRDHWRQVFTSESHHEAWLEENSPAHESDFAAANALLRRVAVPSQELEHEILAATARASNLVRLGICAGRQRFPFPTAAYISFRDQQAGVPAPQAESGWDACGAPPNHSLRFLAIRIRAATHAETQDLRQSLESRLQELSIAEPVEEFLRRLSRNPSGESPYLGITLSNGTISRNGSDGISLSNQQYQLVQYFVTNSQTPKRLETLQDAWGTFRIDGERNVNVQITTVRSAISKTSLALQSLNLAIRATTGGHGYMLLDVSDARITRQRPAADRKRPNNC